MDIDKVFVASILAEGPEALAKAIAKGAGAGRLVGEGKDAFVFMQEYHQKYGKLPQVDLVAGKTRIDLAVELEPVDFCIDEINKRHLFLKMQEGLQGVLSHQEKRDPGTAYAEMEKLLHDLKTDQVGISAVESLFKQGPEVKEFYQRIKSGQRGILTPWEAINESTLGFWPEDLILFVARVGVGKCVDASTEIMDPETGLVHTIEEIYNRADITQISTWSPEEGIHVAPITAKIDTGSKECLRIELNSGRTVVVTPEHPFLTPYGWVRADKLFVRAIVGTPANLPEPRNAVSVSRSYVCDLLTRVDPNNSSGLPNEVFRWNNSSIELLFSARPDTWASSTKSHYEVGYCSEKFARQLQHLATRIGLPLVRWREPDNHNYWRVCDYGRVSYEAPGTPGVIWDGIASIEPAGVRKIYDLTVAPSACFVANDIIVHNTWSAVLLALHAWLTPRPETGERSRVLFITTEVSRMRIGMRFYAAMERLPYGNLTHGRLDAFSEDRFYKAIDRLYEAEGLYIIGGDFDFQLDSISAAIESAKPDLVVLDGVYLLRVAGATRTERMANAFDEVKRLAKRKRVPIVITTQFNREVKKDLAKTVQVESIALSDVGAWNADLIFGLIQTDDMKIEKRMIFKPLKVREGEGKEVTVNWNFDRMDFSELVGDGGGGGDADELGAAKPSADADGFTRNDTDDLPF